MKLPDVVLTRQHCGSLKEDQRDSSAMNSWPDIPSIRVRGCLLAPLGALPVCLLLVRASIAVGLGVICLSSSTTGAATLLLEASSLTLLLVERMSAGGGGFGKDLMSTVSESGVSDLSRDSLVPWLFSELEWSTWGRLGDVNRLTTAFGGARGWGSVTAIGGVLE